MAKWLKCANHLSELVMRSAYKSADINKREALNALCGFPPK